MTRSSIAHLLPITCLCCSLAPAARAALISRSTEISMGREAAQEYERTQSVDADPVLAARVQRIGARLIAVGDTPPYPFEFHEVDTNEINAFALPGGFVYFFRGLAQLMPGDDAMAFVMAHEITHVTQRHGVRQMEKSLALTAVLDSALGRTTTSGILEMVADMHYSRHDEAEADRLGLIRMAKAGFDPSQAVEAMAVIGRVANGERHIPALLRSHPLPASRIAALRREAAELRAQMPPPPKVAAAPPLPQAPPLPPPPAPVVASDLFPLAVGTRWTYRVTDPAEATTKAAPRAFTTSVLEQRPGQAGIYRVRTDLGDGLAATRLVAVTTEGVYAWRDGSRGTGDGSRQAVDGGREAIGGGQESAENGKQSASAQASAASFPPPPVHRLPSGDLWQQEIDLTAPPAGGDPSGEETVRVPAGEYRAVKATQHLPGGETATVWLAPGVGMVRRAWSRTGLVEELESFSKPAPEPDRHDPVQKAQG